LTKPIAEIAEEQRNAEECHGGAEPPERRKVAGVGGPLD
jgi:hypothetical protein